MKAIALIPARGGSKRLPRKNVIGFLGRPIIAYTIEAAFQSGCFDRVVVSTDDEEISDAAKAAGADVVIRPSALASDEASVVETCLDFLETKTGYDVLCCLYATAPLRNADDIRHVVSLIDPGRCDFAMALTEYSYPPFQALRQTENGSLAPMFPNLVEKQTQDIGPLLVDNGSTYAASIPAFQQTCGFYGPGLKGHVMPQSRSVDLDGVDDLRLLEFFAKSEGL